MPSSHAPIIVGVSHHQPAVLRHALLEARRLGVAVRVVHCYSALAGDVYMGSDPDEVMRAAGDAVLIEAQSVVDGQDHDGSVEYLLVRGDPATCLVEEAADAAAVVVGADDASWLERMLGGDVSGHLALKAACPVVVVPQAFDEAAASDGVVVTLDGDTSSAGPLRYGFEQAESRAEDLHVLHATPAATSEADVTALTAKVTLDVARWNELTPTVKVLLSLTNGDALEQCIAATSKASMLVIGRPHGHAFSFALTRPVAMLVLREARCPVAIVPAGYGRV